MPTYNYYCKHCDSHFSYFQKMSEISHSICEECGGNIERVITGGTGLIFKGSGFYLTDYKDEKKADNENVTKEAGNMEKSKKVKKETQTSKSESESTSKKSGNTDE